MIRSMMFIIVALVLTACGTGKAAMSSEGEAPGLTNAEIDTIQHDAARLAMENGEFVFMISRAIRRGKVVYTTPQTNYFEVTGGKWFLQERFNPKKNAERTAGRVMKTDITSDSSSYILRMDVHTAFNGDLRNAVITLYPGSNKASGDLRGAWGMKIEGVVVPRRVANIARIAPPSPAEEWDAW